MQLVLPLVGRCALTCVATQAQRPRRENPQLPPPSRRMRTTTMMIVDVDMMWATHMELAKPDHMGGTSSHRTTYRQPAPTTAPTAPPTVTVRPACEVTVSTSQRPTQTTPGSLHTSRGMRGRSAQFGDYRPGRRHLAHVVRVGGLPPHHVVVGVVPGLLSIGHHHHHHHHDGDTRTSRLTEGPDLGVGDHGRIDPQPQR